MSRRRLIGRKRRGSGATGPLDQCRRSGVARPGLVARECLCQRSGARSNLRIASEPCYRHTAFVAIYSGRDSGLAGDRNRSHQRPRAGSSAGWRKPVGQGDVQIGSDDFGSPGGFGSVVWADPDHHLGFGYVRTLCVAPRAEYRADLLLSAII